MSHVMLVYYKGSEELTKEGHFLMLRDKDMLNSKSLEDELANVQGAPILLLDVLRRAVKPGTTELVWIETPGNPLWTITDINGAAQIAHAAGAVLAVDSTIATPVFTQPLSLGADLVMHSASKYLNGHSDVIGGAVATARGGQLWSRIEAIRSQFGLILGPFEAWLLLRGLRTLDVRVRSQSESAALLATWLDTHPYVATVLYPGLPTHRGHDVAARQMSGFGAMVSIRVKGGEEEAIAAAARVSLWKRATSLGGVESLIEHRASIEGAHSPCPSDLLRLSVGLEHPEDLFADLDQALRGLTADQVNRRDAKVKSARTAT